MPKPSAKEIEQQQLLSHFTLENLHDAVFWVRSDQQIFHVNDTACKMTGYTKEELLEKKVTHINPSALMMDFPAFWKCLKKEKKITFESQHRHKTGYLYDIEITGNYVEFEDKEYSCSIVRDIRKRKLEEGLLRTISEATAGLLGRDFFIQLAKYITITLSMRYALITECANQEKTRLRSICYLDKDKILDNVEYDTTGTPCEIIMRGENYFTPDKLQQYFPKEKGLESYIGVPIFSPSTGDVMGHIIAVDPEPVSIDKNQSSILKIFANRAGAELDRLASQRELEKTNERLKNLLDESEQRFRDLFEEAPIAYVHEGLDSKFIKANRAALRILGVKPEEVPFMYGKTMAPDTPDAQRRMKEAFESVGRGTDTSGVILELRRKDNGNPIWIQWWSNPDVGGQFTRTMFIDITEQVLMEQEKARLQAENKYLQEEI